MLITNVRAHHVRISYDAGVASFKQGASAIATVDMVLLEVSIDTGLTGWGDAWGYVYPKTTSSAVDEMIAPQARGLEAPNAAGIPAVMERIRRNLHLFGRYGITMFAISGLDIALRGLAAKAEVGGITEYLKVAALADEMGIEVAPHSPYCGPGFLATLQLMSLRDDGTFIEVVYMRRAACLWRGGIDIDAKGTTAVPEGLGPGYEPDQQVMERYRVS